MTGHEGKRHPMSSRTVARAIGATFGLVFIMVNAGAVDSPWSSVLRALGVVAFVGVIWSGWGRGDVAVRSRPGALRFYWASVALEAFALVVGSRVLTDSGRAEYGVAWVAFAVGFHLLPFAWAFNTPSFLPLGLVLMGLGIIGAALGLAGAGAAAIALTAGVGSGSALVGWAAVPSVVGQVSRQ
jgi:hypothetical protein